MSWTATLELTGRTVLLDARRGDATAYLADLQAAGARIAVLADGSTTLHDLIERGLVSTATVDDVSEAAVVITADEALATRAAELGRPVVRPVARPAGQSSGGRVILVGGGPGDLGLLTLAGLEAVRGADVIVHDRLAPLAALAQAPAHAEIIDVGKIPRGRFTPQQAINQLLVQHALAGRTVVRLKGGDSFVFGRGGEELQACATAGVPVEVLPGVSSALAAPALAGIPLTHRTLVQGFTVISGHLAPDNPGSTLDWAALARSGTTLVILMGVATLPAIAAALIGHGLDADTPAATVADAGLPSQRVVRASLERIAAESDAAGLRAPAVTVIGAVAGFDPYG